jgi:hypothetical protein
LVADLLYWVFAIQMTGAGRSKPEFREASKEALPEVFRRYRSLTYGAYILTPPIPPTEEILSSCTRLQHYIFV